jgi:serine/threonine protein kinase
MDISAITEITRDKATEQPDDIALVKDALGGEYEILGELGRGGMAIVYKALDKNLDREVAVKVLPLSMAYDAEFVERFQREAKTAAKLEHPNVIPVYRVGKTGRIIYFVMKYLRGKSLGDLVDEKGPLAPADIRRVLSESADALGYAHENHVVHRDIKPDNIVFDEKGRAIVTDFGIAKAATGTKLTGTGMAIGTPYYMSPEQARAQDLDGRSDIYSLGVVAFQCLTGHVPFEGDDSFAVGIQHISQELPTPNLTTDDQRDLFTVVKKMLAKAPEDRFQTTAELIRALSGGPTTAATQAMAASNPAGEPVRASTPTTPMPNMGINDAAIKGKTKKKMSPVAMAAIAGLIVIGGGSAVVLSNRSSDETAAPVETASTTATGTMSADRGEESKDEDVSSDASDATGSGSGDDATADQGAAFVAEGQERDEVAVVDVAAPDTTPQVSPAELRWRREVARRIGILDQRAAEQGFESRGAPGIGRLAGSETDSHDMSLIGETDYAIFAFCDDDCTDIDLAVFDANNRQLESDVAVNTDPNIEFAVRRAGTHRLNVLMYGCAARGCRYAFRVYGRPADERPGRRRGRKGQ